MKRTSILLCFAIIFITIGASANKASLLRGKRNNLPDPGASVMGQDALIRAKALIRVVNQYRREKGLEEIPYSPWLTYVARWHVYDLQNNNPNKGSCSMHSWSDNGYIKNAIVLSGVTWSPCCYKIGDAKGCSWDKPKEISNGAYTGVGFEIACGGNGGEMTNYKALECWKKSSPHLDMMLNRGKWSDNEWKAIGAAISYDYAVVWFSEEMDTSSDLTSRVAIPSS